MNTMQMEHETLDVAEAMPEIEVTEVVNETASDMEAEMASKAKKAGKKGGANAKAPKATPAKEAKRTDAPVAKAPPKKRGKAGGLTMGELVDSHAADLAGLGKSDKTIASYKADLRIAAKYFGADRTVASLTAKDVAKYFDSPAVCANRKGGRRNAITIAKVRRTFRMALERLAQVGTLSEAPIPKDAAKAK